MSKFAFITGAAKGIGAACARALAEAGYGIVLHYNSSQKEAEALAQKLGESFLGAYKADLSSAVETKELCEKVLANHGCPEVLVNNAGLSLVGQLQDTSDSDLDLVFGVNLKAPYIVCREFASEMIAKKSGSIINISSMWGVCGASCESAYSASKAGLVGLTQALAGELGPSGVRVNAIAPGAIKTDMLACYSEAELAAFAEETPLQRLGTPEDVAKLCVFLAGDDSSFITGQTISVNGGYIC